MLSRLKHLLKYIGVLRGAANCVLNRWTKLSGTSAVISASAWNMPSNNNLAYTGSTTETFVINASISIASSISNINCYLAVAKNGTICSGTISVSRISTGGDIVNMALNGIRLMSTNDFFELWAFPDTTTSLTIHSTSLLVQAI